MTADEQAGMAWWNALSKEDRGFWLRVASTAVPAEAWAYRKACVEEMQRVAA